MNANHVLNESAAVMRLSAEQRRELFDRFILSGDVSGFTDTEIVSIVVSLCNKHGFDPMQRPFDVLALPERGKTPARKIIYANATATSMVSSRDRISTQIMNRQMLGDMYIVTARATAPDGTFTEQDGVVSLEGRRSDGTSYRLTGEALTNRMMHATTKASRRAVLRKAGLGLLDHSEVEDIVDARIEDIDYNVLIDGHADAIEQWRTELEGCSTAEDLTAMVKQIKGLSEALANDLRPFVKEAQQRLNVIWREGQYWPDDVGATE